MPARRQDNAMAEAIDIHGNAFKNGSTTLLARVVGQNGVNVVQSDINTIKYTVYLLDDQDPDSRTAVSEHTNVTLAVANVIFNTLQTGPIWTVDAVGYNFCHVLNVLSHQAFTIAGRRYLVEYQLSPVVGQMILVRFRINVI
jgi:hypothetical protein